MDILNVDKLLSEAYESYNRYQLSDAYEKVKESIRLCGDSNIRLNILEAKILIALNRNLEAKNMLVEICKNDDTNREAIMELGCLRVKLGDVEQGYNELKKAIELDENELEGKLTFGKVCIDLGKYIEARETYKELINIYPPNVIGSNFISSNKFIIAEIEEKKILTIDDRIELIRSYYYISDNQSSLEMVKTLNIDSSFNYKDLIIIGSVYSSNNENEKALKLYDMAIEKDPNNTRAYIVKGSVLRKIGRLEESYNVLKHIPIVEDKDKDVYSTIAKVAYEIGKYKEAIEYCDKSIESERAMHSCHYLKGKIYNKLGRFDEASKSIDKALKIYGGDGEYYAEKSKALRGLGFIREANDVCERALEFRLETASINFEKGLILKSIGYYENAISWLEVAIEMDEKDSVAKYENGVCLYYLNDYLGAKRIIEELCETFDNDVVLYGMRVLISVVEQDYVESNHIKSEYLVTQYCRKNKKESCDLKKMVYEMCEDLEKSKSQFKSDDEYLRMIEAIKGLLK